ncbi:cytochrome c [Algiphilus sp. W345]|uniref:Cytochrome c n=1 Tax=Banduia mediterranea TaxID=3075609 RepID=A0ABU2WMG0_9GAMM|nr:cytochrome c [Algiphilus sp. W345]MDT0499065.1 cytochrome c [Algiphilus sp. W345]
MNRLDTIDRPRSKVGLLGMVLLGGLLGPGLAGCENAMQDMYDQPRYEPYEPSPLFDNGNSMQDPQPGTVAMAAGRGADASGAQAASAQLEPLPPPDAKNPLPLTMAVLERGRERYEVYCAPCHSRIGDGDGYITRRGFPQPPSFHQDRLRQAPDAHFYQVITGGYGAMLPYAGRLAPQDRWAIIRYIRALQLSQHAPLQQLPDKVRAEAEAALK